MAKSATKALADELMKLIPALDAEGLSFLIEQANVHLYNMRVAELEESQSRLDSIKAAHGKGKPARANAAATDSDFRIESAGNGSAYDLIHDNKWKMFTSDEMLAMVRIVSAKDPVDQLGGRLYRWLMAERMDVIQDIPLSGLADPLLKKLVVKLKTTFTVKGGT